MELSSFLSSIASQGSYFSVLHYFIFWRIKFSFLGYYYEVWCGYILIYTFYFLVDYNEMNVSSQGEFEEALTGLQHVLIARRVLASDEQIRLNWNHFHILILINNSPGILPSEISESLLLPRPTVSKHLKYLKSKRLIKTKISTRDTRSYSVRLTKSAENILRNIFKGQQENARLASGVLSENEVKQFTKIAQKITSALDGKSLKEI